MNIPQRITINPVNAISGNNNDYKININNLMSNFSTDIRQFKVRVVDVCMYQPIDATYVSGIPLLYIDFHASTNTNTADNTTSYNTIFNNILCCLIGNTRNSTAASRPSNFYINNTNDNYIICSRVAGNIINVRWYDLLTITATANPLLQTNAASDVIPAHYIILEFTPII